MVSELSEREVRELMDIQERFLALPSVVFMCQRYGEGECICGEGSPTYAQVRAGPLPQWKEWLQSYLGCSKEQP